MKMKRYIKESSDNEEKTLKDIERSYGVDVAKALEKYCAINNIGVLEVVGDMKTDGNGMTQWDKFDVWAKRKMHLDIMGGFDDSEDWTGAEDDKKREKDRERDEEKVGRKVGRRRGGRKPAARKPKSWFKENSGSVRDPQDVLDFIAEELGECEWVSNVDYDDYDSKCYVNTTDGKTFVVNVDWDKV